MVLFVEERMVEGKSPLAVEGDHKARYNFAVPFCHDKRILDVACGTGYGSEILAKSSNSQVVGCDSSVEAITEARRRQPRDRLFFCRVDATSLPFTEAQFDVCVSFETMEHVSDPSAFIKELHRVCREDGLLILSTPNRRVYSPGTLPGMRPRNPFHIREFVLGELLSALASGGFSAIRLYGQHFENMFRVRGWDLISRHPSLRMSVQTVVRSLRGAWQTKSDSLLAPGPPPEPRVVRQRGLREPEYHVIVCKKPGRPVGASR
jgi:ubiquinone/menaquinone biosynthesis C-methylase UbiE